MTRLECIDGNTHLVKPDLRVFGRNLFLLCLGIITAVSFSPAASATTFRLMVSAFADRSSPAALSGQALAGNVYVFVAPYTGVSRVKFYLDDPTMSGSSDYVDRDRPFDLAGTAKSGLANPYDTTRLAAGNHTITVKVVPNVGGAVTIQRTFTTGSGTAASGSSSATLSWIAPSTRSDGSALSLSAIAGYRIYHGSAANQLKLLANLNDPTATTYRVSRLLAGTHYFAITAYDVSGMESKKSEVLRKTIQ